MTIFQQNNYNSFIAAVYLQVISMVANELNLFSAVHSMS